MLRSLTVALLIATLASDLAVHFFPPHQPAGYSTREVEQLNDLTETVTHPKHRSLRERQAEAIALVYGVNAGNMNAYRGWWK